MNVLKWVLVICGVVFLIALAVVVGGAYWASTVESVKLTQDDLKVGGTYRDDERETLLEACRIKLAASAPEACTCLADEAGPGLTRIERLTLTAGFEGSPTKIVALTKGLIDSGLPRAEVEAMEAGSETRIDAVLKACGMEEKS